MMDSDYERTEQKKGRDGIGIRNKHGYASHHVTFPFLASEVHKYNTVQ